MSSSGKSIDPVLVTPLRSPAARKKARLQAQLGWRRIAVRLLIGGVLAACLVRLGAIALQPMVATYRSGRDIESLESQYRAELQRRNRLQREIRFLSTNAGVEEEARRLGWVKEGETSLQIVTPAGVAKSQLPPVNPPKPLSGSERLKQWLGTWFSGFSRESAKKTAPAG